MNLAPNLTAPAADRPTRGTRAASRAALDVMLTDAAIEPGAAPARAARRRAAAGRRAGAPAAPRGPARRRARRRAQPDRGRQLGHRTAQGRPALRRPRLAATAGCSTGSCRPTSRVGGTVAGLVDDAGLDWRTDLRARFVLDNLLDALAPTNFPLTNPQVLKETIDRGGENLVTGALRFAARRRAAAGCRRWSTRAASRSAATSRVSEGSVVLRTDVFELIHYKPTTAEVYETPLLIVPPTINKFYIVDLAPGRSLIEHLRRPGPPGVLHLLAQPRRRARATSTSTPTRRRCSRRATRSPRSRGRDAVNVMAACSGGIITARAARPSRRGGPARRGREPDAARLRARQRAGGHDRGARHPAGRGGGRGRVGAARLPRRRRAGQRVLVAAPERPDLELRRQQLPARQGAAGVRHPLLEPGHRPHGRGPAPRLRDDGARERARDARAGCACSAATWTSARSTSTRTSSPGPTTTSSTGATPTARRSCSAATAGSCSRRAVTSRR